MSSSVLAECEKRGHEQVVFFNYPEAGLKAIIGIHNTVLGPALGGCRMRAYQNEAQAVEDVMRLSEGMTYKSALAGLDLGGGKACIVADPRMESGPNREKMFQKFGECIQLIAGRYITAEDMGTSVADMGEVRKNTRFVVGIDPEQGGIGDPSPYTALGVFHAITAACERRYGSKDVKGKRVALQGVGHVGRYLLELLRKNGAAVTVCDVNDAAAKEVGQKYGASVVPPDAIYDVPCEIYAPCAIGQTVNERTIQRLHCEIIAGAANNQLSDPSIYTLITKRNMTYCPDFAINAGGVISVAAELQEGGASLSWVKEKVDGIFQTTHRILDEAERRKKFPEAVAIDLAKERISKAKKQ